MATRSGARRLALAGAVLALAATAGVGLPDRAAAAAPRVSLPTIERQLMCVTCKIPLNVAQSPQAERERAYIQALIERGYGEPQIKRALVARYGQAVLALPSAHGFGLAAYLVPLAVVVGLVVGLALMLPRWRRRGRGEEERGSPAPPLSSLDAARLDADLARFD